MTRNPITEARETLGLDRKAAAIRAGVGYQTMAALEGGYRRMVSAKILTWLAREGLNAQEIGREYQTWREGLA